MQSSGPQILLPSWLNSRMAPRVGLLLGAALLVTALCFLLYAQRDIERHELNNTRLYARVLQDHADHTLLSSSVVLRSLEKSVGPGASMLTQSAVLVVAPRLS
jgi:tRNA pseudouridine-54 N-methylase